MNQFKVGDTVECINGIGGGGAGHSIGFTFEVIGISFNSDGKAILWGGIGGNGVFATHVKLKQTSYKDILTAEEQLIIEKLNQMT